VANEDGFEFLKINQSHIISYNSLILISDHKDPFDRLLISTAISEKLPIISSDEKFKLYGDIFDLIVA
jgi:PIN domain nuclease of toxin-antitoxin system